MQIQQTCVLSNEDIKHITDALPMGFAPENVNEVVNRVATLVQQAFVLGQKHRKP